MSYTPDNHPSPDSIAQPVPVKPAGRGRQGWSLYAGVLLAIALVWVVSSWAQARRAARAAADADARSLLAAHSVPVSGAPIGDEALITVGTAQPGRDAFLPQGLADEPGPATVIVAPPGPLTVGTNPPNAGSQATVTLPPPMVPPPPSPQATQRQRPPSGGQAASTRPADLPKIDVPTNVPPPTQPPPAGPPAGGPPGSTPAGRPPAPPPGSATGGPPRSEPTDLTLDGVVLGERPMAVLRVRGQAQRVSEGESLGRIRVTRIEESRIQVEEALDGRRTTRWVPLKEGALVGGVRSGPVKTVVRPGEDGKDE